MFILCGKWSEIEGLLTWTNERMTRDRVNNTPPSADFKDTGFIQVGSASRGLVLCPNYT